MSWIAIETASGELADIVEPELRELVDSEALALVHKVLYDVSRDDEDSFPTLYSIAPYEKTTFNHLQIEKQFLPEWRRLYERDLLDDERNALERVEQMAQRCSQNAGLFLTFHGD